MLAKFRRIIAELVNLYPIIIYILYIAGTHIFLQARRYQGGAGIEYISASGCRFTFIIPYHPGYYLFGYRETVYQ